MMSSGGREKLFARLAASRATSLAASASASRSMRCAAFHRAASERGPACAPATAISRSSASRCSRICASSAALAPPAARSKSPRAALVRYACRLRVLLRFGHSPCHLSASRRVRCDSRLSGCIDSHRRLRNASSSVAAAASSSPSVGGPAVVVGGGFGCCDFGPSDCAPNSCSSRQFCEHCCDENISASRPYCSCTSEPSPMHSSVVLTRRSSASSTDDATSCTVSTASRSHVCRSRVSSCRSKLSRSCRPVRCRAPISACRSARPYSRRLRARGASYSRSRRCSSRFSPVVGSPRSSSALRSSALPSLPTSAGVRQCTRPRVAPAPSRICSQPPSPPSAAGSSTASTCFLLASAGSCCSSSSVAESCSLAHSTRCGPLPPLPPPPGSSAPPPPSLYALRILPRTTRMASSRGGGWTSDISTGLPTPSSDSSLSRRALATSASASLACSPRRPAAARSSCSSSARRVENHAKRASWRCVCVRPIISFFVGLRSSCASGPPSAATSVLSHCRLNCSTASSTALSSLISCCHCLRSRGVMPSCNPWPAASRVAQFSSTSESSSGKKKAACADSRCPKMGVTRWPCTSSRSRARSTPTGPP